MLHAELSGAHRCCLSALFKRGPAEHVCCIALPYRTCPCYHLSSHLGHAHLQSRVRAWTPPGRGLHLHGVTSA